MSASFVVHELAQGRISLALPLLRATWPKMDISAWEGFVDAFRRHYAAPAGITGLYDASGALCGLFASRIEPGLRAMRILAIPLFTVMDIGNSLGPVRALLDAAEAKATELDCFGVQIHLASEQNALARRLRNLGLEQASTLYLSTAGAAQHRA
jgi:hypothetical protein